MNNEMWFDIGYFLATKKIVELDEKLMKMALAKHKTDSYDVMKQARKIDMEFFVAAKKELKKYPDELIKQWGFKNEKDND